MKAIDFAKTAESFDLVPQEFLEASDGQFFYITADFFKRELVRLVLEDIEVTEDYVAFRVRFQAMVNEESHLETLKASQRGSAGRGAWLKGFRSGKLKLTSVQAESIFNATEMAALEQHAELWEEGDMYTGERARVRLYLTAAHQKAALRYQLVDRFNPNTGEAVPGLQAVSWQKMKLIGTGVSSYEDVDLTEFTVEVNQSVADVARIRKSSMA